VFGVVTDWIPTFIPDYGVTSQLITDQPHLLKTDDGQYVDTASNHAYNPADSVFGDSYVLKLRSGVELAINATTGDLASITDLSGNQLKCTGDGISATNLNDPNALARKVQFEYDTAGNITAVIDPAGKRITYGYDGIGNLIGVTDRTGNTTQFTYRDAPSATGLGTTHHYLDQIIDPLGVQAARTEYYPDGRIKKVTDAAGKTIEYAYDVAGRTETITDQLGYQTVQTMNQSGDVVRELRPDGGITTRAFDTNHHLLTQTVVVGQEDSTQNGETNDLTTVNTYDTAGNLTSTTDPRGLVTRMTYNEFGQVTSTTDAFGNVTQAIYDAQGLPTQTIDNNGNKTTYTYDDRGNVQTIKNDAGVVLVTNTYNDFGDLWTTTNNAGQTTTNTYDVDGHLISTSTTATNPLGQPVTLTISTDFDDASRVLTTRRVKSVNGGPEIVISTTSATINDNGRLATSTDENGLVSEYTYDNRGLVIQTRTQRADSSGNVTWYCARTVYDAGGRAIDSTDEYREGTMSPVPGTRTTYDAMGRVVLTERLSSIDISLTGTGTSCATAVTSTGAVISSSGTTYDSLGRALTNTDTYGNQTLTTYDRFGNITQTLTKSRDENGNVVWLVSRTVYDSFGRAYLSTDQYIDATGTSASSGPVRATKTLYNSNGRSFGTQRLSGVVVTLDATSGQTTTTNGGTVLSETRTVYDSKGRVSQTVSETGAVTKYEYDSLGRQTVTIGPMIPLSGVAGAGPTGTPGATAVALRSETVYDSQGRVWKQRTNIRQYDNGTIDASRVEETIFAYDENGNVTKTTFADGTFVTATYDDLGRKTSDTNQLGLTRSFAYVAQGRLTSVTLPDLDGNPATTNDRATYQYGYDTQGNQTLLVDPLGRETRWTFDDQGRELTRTLPLGFGADGKEGTADDAAVTPGDFTEHFEYDAHGRQILAVSFEGVVTRFVYDDTNGGQLLRKEFFGNLTAYDNGAGAPAETWSYTYDAFGRPVKVDVARVSDPDVRTETTTYDNEGHVATVSTPEGVLRYSYDTLGRLAQTAVYTAGANVATATPQRTTTYMYDILGRLATVTEDRDATATTDALLTTKYYYDLEGNLDLTVLPNNVAEDYVYDNLNRLDKLTDYVTNGTASDLADLSDNSKLAEYDYTVRADGRRTDLVETLWTATGNVTDIFDWKYDNLGRLTEEKFQSTSPDLSAYKANYSYDLTGNRLVKTIDNGINGTVDETTTYGYDANDRLRTEGLNTNGQSGAEHLTTYGYDHTQSTSKDVVKADGSSESIAYAFDLQGRMAVVTDTTTNVSGATTQVDRTTYGYNSQGIRMSALAETDTNGDGTWDKTTRTEFLTDDQTPTGYSQTLRESTYDAQSNLVKTVDYSFGHDELTQVTRTYDSSGAVTTEQSLVFHHDGHGSVRILTNLAASLVQFFAYDAYGQLVAILNGSGQVVSGGGAPAARLASTALALTSILANGEFFDTRAQFMYLRARWYDATTGEFMGLDDFRGNNVDPQSFHKYLFTHGDPVNGVDPSGMYEIDVHQYLTWYLARAAGFSDATAKDIGFRAQSADKPGSTKDAMYGGVNYENMRDYHFVSQDRLMALYFRMVKQLEYVAEMEAIGDYFHALEDTYSHTTGVGDRNWDYYHDFDPFGSFGEFGDLGHGLHGHDPDFTWKDVAKADKMAEIVFIELVWLAKGKGFGGAKKWSEIKAKVHEFNAFKPETYTEIVYTRLTETASFEGYTKKIQILDGSFMMDKDIYGQVYGDAARRDYMIGILAQPHTIITVGGSKFISFQSLYDFGAPTSN
jgi:RHS repeat-associated protein